MLRFLLLLILIQSFASLTGQTTFKKRYGTSGNDRAWCLEVLPDNSFIVGGGTTGGGLGSEDAIITKFSADGVAEWSRVFGGPDYEWFTQLLACSDGNFLAVGTTNSIGGGAWDIYIVKFDINGNVLWERTRGGSNLDVPNGVCETSDGYIITGGCAGCGGGGYDILVFKTDFDGNSIWDKVYGSSGQDMGGKPMEMPNGQIWMVGYLNVNSSFDGVRMRLDAGNGNLLETVRIGGTATNENISALVPGGPGFVGSGYATSGNQPRGWMLGFNGSGAMEWVKQYIIPGVGNYEIRAENSPNGGLIFTPYGHGPDHPEAYLVKTDDNGDITWAKAYPFNGNGRTHQVKPAPDGGYIVVGYCAGAGEDFFILKTDANGNVEGCCPMDAPVTVETVTPPFANISVNGYWASSPVSATGENQDVDLDETNLCNGSDCCPTDAGTLLEQTLHVCINQTATLTHNGDEVLDADDLLQFILFSDLADTLGSIIATSNTPSFTFNPATMQTGVTYYVAAIAGNNVGGNVDFDDPCFDISNAAELIWHPLPEVELQTDNSDVCPGDCRTLTATLTGTPPFTLTVSSPAGTVTVTIQNNTGTFQICPPPGTPPGSFTVQATALTDLHCACP